MHSMPGIWAWLDAWPAFERPARLRGDIAYGNESVLREVEARHQRYLTKLWLTKNVRRLVTRVVAHPGWEREGQGVTRPCSVGAALGVSSFFVVKEVAVGRGRVGRCRPQCWLGEGQASGRRRGSGLRLRAARPQEEKLRHHRAPAQSRERRLAGHLAHPDRDGVQHPCQWNPFPINQVEWPSRKG